MTRAPWGERGIGRVEAEVGGGAGDGPAAGLREKLVLSQSSGMAPNPEAGGAGCRGAAGGSSGRPGADGEAAGGDPG